MPIENHAGGTSITGNAINWYRLKVIISAARLYLKTGMKANSMYTPTNMKNCISEYTGKVYPRSRKGLETAVADIEKLLKNVHPDQVER